ncbi:MAG: hypothetical protein HYW77_02360 [Parcubacteria group bacterium]|nr:hypothetical protein [Parcubacteria group bacterium]
MDRLVKGFLRGFVLFMVSLFMYAGLYNNGSLLWAASNLPNLGQTRFRMSEVGRKDFEGCHGSSGSGSGPMYRDGVDFYTVSGYDDSQHKYYYSFSNHGIRAITIKSKAFNYLMNQDELRLQPKETKYFILESLNVPYSVEEPFMLYVHDFGIRSLVGRPNEFDNFVVPLPDKLKQ